MPTKVKYKDVKYKDKVIITKGFYKGQTGKVIKDSTDDTIGYCFDIKLSDGNIATEVLLSHFQMKK